MNETPKKENIPLDPDKLYAALEEKIKNSGHPMDLGRIRAAYEMAKLAHAGQLRKDGCSPYVTHCVAAADISVDLGLDEDSICAALLHDVIEDTPLTHADIAHQFGAPVADIVEGVTKLTRVQYTSKEDEQMENLRKMLMAMAKDIRVILIKISSAPSRWRPWRSTPPSPTAWACSRPSGSWRICRCAIWIPPATGRSPKP